MSSRARALVSIGSVAVLLFALWLGPEATAVVGAVIGIVLAVGWPFLIDLPNPGTARRVIIGSAVASALVCYYLSIREVAFLAGLIVIIAFIAEMARRDGRPRLLEQISGTVSGAILALMAGLWTRALQADPVGVEAARAVLVAVVVATVCELLIPHSLRHLRHFVYMVGGFLGGLGYMLFADIDWYLAAIAGFAAGVILAIFDSVLRRLPPATRRRPGMALAMVPLCVAAVVAYTLVLALM